MAIALFKHLRIGEPGAMNDTPEIDIDYFLHRIFRHILEYKMGCFESLITWAEAFSGLPRQSLAFVIEPTNIYHEQLVQFLHSKGTTVYLVNPGRVRKFAEGIGILSKNDVIDADLLARYGLMAKNLIVFEPAPQEVNDLRSLLNRLDVLEKNLRRELNRLEKAGKSLTFHRLEQQSITRSVKRHEAEIPVCQPDPKQRVYGIRLTHRGGGSKPPMAQAGHASQPRQRCEANIQ